jgi:hypothetical protein
MPTERVAYHESLIDVLDRVLDKGLVIDASLRASVSGIEIMGIEARVVVAPIQTYEGLASTALETRTGARPLRRRSATLALATEAVPRRRRRTQDTVNARCQHGCTFVMKRAALPSTVTCPFDGSRMCSVAAPAA